MSELKKTHDFPARNHFCAEQEGESCIGNVLVSAMAGGMHDILSKGGERENLFPDSVVKFQSVWQIR